MSKKKKVLYKLKPEGVGYVHPEEISNGKIWESAKDIKDMIFVGEIDVDNVDNVPTIIETISDSKVNKKLKDISKKDMQDFKAKCYAMYTDKLFMEAFREKELGNDKKWKEYLKKAKKIKSLKSIPKNGMIEF